MAPPGYGYDNVYVSKLLIHPIKSCRGISVQSAKYTPEGLENDRLWCIVDAETKTAITAHGYSKMVLITTQILVDENSPYNGVMTVSFPADSGCDSFDIPLRPSDDMLTRWQSIDVAVWESVVDSRICEAVSPGQNVSSILSKFFEKSVHLVYKGQRPRPCDPTDTFPQLKATTVYQDGYPLLFLSEESVQVIESATRSQVGKQGVDNAWGVNKLVVERFRPNIIFKGGGPFAEDVWEEIGIIPQHSSLKEEEIPSFLVVSKCVRCLFPNVCPDAGIRDQAVPYKILMKIRTGIDPKQSMKPCVGCYGVPLHSGIVSVGDKVVVKRMPPSLGTMTM